ncbi:Pentatricopeptide repeat-containing protein At1g34160 [Linum perenne]
MLRGSHKVDALTCSFVLKACARVLALSESIQLHSQIVRRGFIADALLGTTLLDLYAKGGEIREEKGEIHKFYNGDKSHDNWKKIYAKLEEIRFKMKEFGYVAETSFVLHDIGDEEKENALYQHSEKLAVAYGLVCANDEDGTPIQVIKNLRICGDCHVVMKLVSKMYNREIIVRDRVRFHRFKDGICSCRDYW